MKRLLISAAACAALALTVTSCSDDESPKDEATQAASELCSDLSELKADNAKLKALDASATKEQFQDAYNDVVDDWDDVSEHLNELDSAKKDAVQGAADDLKQAYGDLPGDTTGAQGVAKLKPQIEKLDETVAAASTGLKCP
ncbi:hypothetical protein G6045_00475 [Streptomyces sp. YC504]|uniref:Small secreted protein n=1 Tax=Streptomyces mesophilus TaxID=1775132 RepID=A0A6G4X9E4_9ACTN|nr:hypothetical protein [Streptomyces mesophilus]NGO74169.1 hypothetical protein [Streptomyces mesophilus]